MRAEQRLRDFLADTVHELRTPLTSIQGFAELYRHGGLRHGTELDEAMAAIESEVGRMRLLVNDLLLLAHRMSGGRFRARRWTCSKSPRTRCATPMSGCRAAVALLPTRR